MNFIQKFGKDKRREKQREKEKRSYLVTLCCNNFEKKKKRI